MDSFSAANLPAANLSADETDLIRARTSVGDFELIVCTDGPFLMDGGAMFGVVPKPLWERRIPADAHNRVRLGLNTAVVRTGKHTVLIETGIGNKQPDRMQTILQNQALLPASLASAGILHGDVDVVINTHLHFDHCGWNTTLHPDGTVSPTFPNARYYVHAGEVAHAHQQLDRDRVSYLSPNYDPLIESGQMTLLTSASILADPALCHGISVELFPGHTAHMLAVHIQPPHAVESRPSAARAPHACYIGDLIPTTHHLDPTWVMGFDLDPLRTIEERKRFYSRAIPEEWLVLFTHDHEQPMARLRWGERGKPTVT